MTGGERYDVVIPTVGRPSLAHLLAGLASGHGPLPERVLIVDDRRHRPTPLTDGDLPERLAGLVKVIGGRAQGPAAARNDGWREAAAPWVVFLDDDVVVGSEWKQQLAADLYAARMAVAGVQGGVVVPVPDHRRPTDWERNVAGLEAARWATADMAVRRAALASVGGFDERFPRAYREDADLALRLLDAGWELMVGRRTTIHPVRPAPWHVSVGLQRGNADDPLMAAVHGRDWRARAGVPTGRRRRHLAVAAAGVIAAGAAAAGQRRVAASAFAGWAVGTVELGWARVAPGPRTASEVAAMAATSTVLPFAATWHWLRGLARRRRLAVPERAPRPERPAAVLFDRDGTLVHDVPYNGDPARVQPVPEAKRALARLRAAGVPVGVISNQSGVARGLITPSQVEAVNARLDELLGPFDVILSCLHGPDDGCGCRKPAPGLVVEAARTLGVAAECCAVVGDIAADVEAALAAGGRGILVPNPITSPAEVGAAPEVAPDLLAAVDLLLGAREPAGDRP